MHRKHRLTAVILAVFCLAVLVQAGLASIILVSYTATAQADGTILVAWETGTELYTSSYRLYRSESEAPADWGSSVVSIAAGGGISPQKYEYVDADVTPGVRYYYLLEDLSTTGGVTPHGPVSAQTGPWTLFLPLVVR